MSVAVAAAKQDPNPIPGLVLLALLLAGFVLWRHRRRTRADRPRQGIRRLWRPPLVLAFLAPFCLEGFAGASPPQVFFNPFVLVYFMIFYGSAAILIREATLAWGKGWPTVLALGAAYGICEEGLSTKVFFDLQRTNLGPQMQYGTWGGVHWPYAFHLITAHAVFSIAVPIFLTTLLFPEQRSTPWVRRRTLPALGAAFLAAMLFSALVVFKHDPTAPHHVIAVTPPHYVIAILVVLLLIAVTRCLPAKITLPGRRLTMAPRRLAIFGFCGMFAYWLVSYLFAAWHVPAGVTLSLEVTIVAIAIWFALRISTDEYGSFALVGGMLSFFVFSSFILMALGSVLQPVVSLAGGYGLVRFGRVLRARASPDTVTASQPRGDR